MAKSTKLEDYWRQNNIEGLFKDLTHSLVQKMPPDPVAAIVQYLQKKYPKSFKTSTDNNNLIDTLAKTTTSLQTQINFSPRSDTNNDSISGRAIQRRPSNLSQVSGIVTIPTPGSAFTDLLKHDTSTPKEAPDLNLRNLIFADRLAQQGIRLGKDIRSDRDILEEELIKPRKESHIPSTRTPTAAHPVGEDLQHEQTHEEPTVQQLVRYKQHIRLENDRRIHREKLADIAKQAREKEGVLYPDTPIQQQDKTADVDPSTEHKLAQHKPVVKSKEEEELLNDENVFQTRQQRFRERTRTRTKTITSRANSPTLRQQYIPGLASTMTRGGQNSLPMMQFGICKICGNILNNVANQSASVTQQFSSLPTGRLIEPQQSKRSVETSGSDVDDWFESASEVSGPREIVPWKADEITPQPANNNPFQQMFFQPINDNNTTQDRPPKAPLIITDDNTNKKRLTPRMSESDVFVRTPEPIATRRSSTSRSITSPVPKKRQTDTLTVTDNQLSNMMGRLSPSQTVPIQTRRMSDWSTHEDTPDDSNQN